MKINNQELAQLLVEQQYIAEKEAKEALEQSERAGTYLGDYVVDHQLLTRDLLGQAVAEHLQMRYVDINSNAPTKEDIGRIPEDIGTTYRLVFIEETQDGVVVATDEPSMDALEALRPLFPEQKITLAFALTEDIDKQLISYRKELGTRFAKIIEEESRVAPEIIEEILKDAIAFNTSDIHFEPQEEQVLVRFRIDGLLQDAGRIPKQYFDNILNRIKVLTHLPTDEHYSALDGSMRFEHDNRKIDIRVSIVPIVDGEKVVMRLLASYLKSFALSDLGLSPEDEQKITRASKKPFGMILVTGPTGSGKTTTLYGILRTLNDPTINISTIEDPVEYKIPSVNHIQVNAKTDLTFAKGLRSIVRQDPDVILVGEIRDIETAEVSVNAALTGHLLLSTFHANDAATAIPRLMDMEVEPFLLSSTLEIIVAQRLARKICDSCRYSYTATKAEINKEFPGVGKYFKEKPTLYKGKGCGVCGDTGYKGRVGIYEVIETTAEMRELILKNPSSGEVWKLAKKQGAKSLFEDGIDKVKNGMTTIEEITRVAREKDY